MFFVFCNDLFKVAYSGFERGYGFFLLKNSYGKIRNIVKRSLDSFGRVQQGNHSSCSFMYQGQYYDQEIELAYNRFRYYSPDSGTYIGELVYQLVGENGVIITV